MDFSFSPEDIRFREEVRNRLRDSVPPDMALRARCSIQHPNREDALGWTKILHSHGWSVPHWPAAHGGTGWSGLQQHIFEDECWSCGAPQTNFQGLRLVGPVICEYGSREQQQRFLPGIREGSVLWAQGFSEPGAGSDLASLKTTAIPNGDNYIVNGQKVWTSSAHHADWGFFLVRTNREVKAQSGVSFLLIDMASPGVSIHPIISLDGGHHLNSVFLDNVVVPKENLVGEEGKGWSYAKFLLGNERTSSSFINWTKHELEWVKLIAREEMCDGRPLIESPEFRQKLVRVEIEAAALEWSVLRILCDEKSRHNSVALTSALKVRGATLQQRITVLAMDALGSRALRYFDPHTPIPAADRGHDWPDYVQGRTGLALFLRAASLYGGTDEVQKNIIAKAEFGL